MGKKSKRQGAAAQRQQVDASLTSKAVCRIVDELWNMTHSFPFPSTFSAQLEEYGSISTLTAALVAKQGVSPPLPPRKDGLPAFKEWLRSKGVEHSKLEVEEFENVGFGLRATSDIKFGEKVMIVPVEAMMSSRTARASPLGPLIAQDRVLQALPNVCLALHLLESRLDPNSPWKPYISTLPHSFTTPLNFTRDDLLMLQASPTLSECLNQHRNIVKLYSHLHKLLREHTEPSLHFHSIGFRFQDFVWAVSCVMSRQNEIPMGEEGRKGEGEGQATGLSLIPLWDMSNHSSGCLSTDYNTDSQACECYAPRDVSAGKEFCIFYGERSNADLLVHSGFVHSANEHDSLKIKLGLSSEEGSETRNLKSMLLQKIGLPTSGHFTLLSSSVPFSKQLLAFVRVFVASVSTLQSYLCLKEGELKALLTSCTVTREDTRVMDFLEKRCSLLLKAYRTTLEEDRDLLIRGDLPTCSRLAVELRMCEKRILMSGKSYASQVHQHLRSTDEEREAKDKSQEQTSNGAPETLLTASKADSCSATSQPS